MSDVPCRECNTLAAYFDTVAVEFVCTRHAEERALDRLFADGEFKAIGLGLGNSHGEEEPSSEAACTV